MKELEIGTKIKIDVHIDGDWRPTKKKFIVAESRYNDPCDDCDLRLKYGDECRHTGVKRCPLEYDDNFKYLKNERDDNKNVNFKEV